MIGEKQYLLKIRNIKKVVSVFLSTNNITIEEVSKITGIPRSSVQRYLHDPIIKEIFGEDSQNIINCINEKLELNYYNGKKIGGDTYASNNVAIKDDSGHFIGSRKK